MRFTLAIALLVAAEVAHGFFTGIHPMPSLPRTARRISASSEFYADDAMRAWNREEYTGVLEDAEDTEEAELELKRQRVQQRQMAGHYRVLFPLIQEPGGESIGIALTQIDAGRKILDRELNLGNLEISKLDANAVSTSVERMDPVAVLRQLDGNFRGVVVSQVAMDSVAWKQGVRAGDVLRAVSATVGNALWPKTSLEGVKSALISRRVMSAKVTFEFERLSESSSKNLFELTLTKPLGLQIQEVDDYVVVTGINENASTLVRYAVQIGDRVVAVDSSLGGTLWPVSTVEGVISACTSRLPGQSITFQFERPLAVVAGSEEAVSSDAAPRIKQAATELVQTTVTEVPPTRQELIKRCRDVLRRYSTDGKYSSLHTKLDGVPALVADKVVDALASASLAIDPVTLSMIMRTYLSCNQPEDAIRIFEAAVGFRADGSLTPVTTMIYDKKGEGHIRPTESGLNVYTGTLLMQAHAMRGDMGSVWRVLAALEGRSGMLINGLEVAPWPWTGSFGPLQPDTQCYNVALAAAEKIGGTNAVKGALELFDERMRNPKEKANPDDRRPVKDLFTYNTMLSALSNANLSGDVFRLFAEMKRAGVRPDKYTYSALLKATTDDADLQEILYDMKERGIQPDVITYNSIIKALCGERRWSQATRLITDMESRGISPDSMTYGLLMSAMLRADKPNACLTLFEAACGNERTSSLTHNVHLYTTAITAASILGDHERALELVSRMTANGVRPNLKTLTSVVGACLAAKKYDLAADVYRQIPQPDSYAMTQGLQAYCGIGDFQSAAVLLKEHGKGNREMSGKDAMRSYQIFLQAALKSKEYGLARDMMSDLLKKGYIPSVKISVAIVEAFEINVRSIVEADADDNMRFRFLLFVLDSMTQRKLPIDGELYAGTLLLARQIGGVPRKLANLMLVSRTNADTQAKSLLLTTASTGNESTQSWESLLLNFSEIEQNLEPSRQPRLTVRVAARDVKRVFRAEQTVLFKDRKMRKQLATATNTP